MSPLLYIVQICPQSGYSRDKPVKQLKINKIEMMQIDTFNALNNTVDLPPSPTPQMTNNYQQ